MNLLSIVVPVFNEATCIEDFVAAISQLNLSCDREIIFVDDGSSDSSLAIIKKISEQDKTVRYISFSRNFGKEAALLAGLQKADGKYVVTMDVDLQDPPLLLPQMIQILEEGVYDSVATRRYDRKGEPFIRSWFARRFYWLMRHFSDVELVDGARDFRMMRKNMVSAICAMPEVNRFIKGIYQWVGFKTKWISYSNIERVSGETKWSFWKLFCYSIDGILAFSTMPLHITLCLGIIGSVISFIVLMFEVIRKLIVGDPVADWPLLVCIIVFFGQLQLFFVGVLGMYIAKMYRETKRRPIYLIAEESK